MERKLSGTGAFAGYNRTLFVPISSEVHTGPRTPGDPVQTFPTDMFRLRGELFGDPDFCIFRITSGMDFGLPSPGQTTLTQQPSGDFVVDSFFDITYQIEFQGCPGSPLDGLSGTTMAITRIQTNPCYGCTSPDNGSDTADFPPDCPYDNPDANIIITEGLPGGSTLILDGPLESFTNVTVVSGSIPEGQTETFDSYLALNVTGTGSLAGFNRSLSIPTSCEVHMGPRTPSGSLQTFTNEMYRLEGELFGDPDFDVLRIKAGEGYGLPSPGQTKLTKLPSGDFAVDSFFDITYEIEFQGTPGSPLDSMAGKAKGSIRLFTNDEPNSFIEAGVDYWATTGAEILFGAGEVPPIPADFFGPGSDPFDRVIYMKGKPVDPEKGLADTIVERTEDAVPDPSPATIPIEIIELNLISSEPIRVTFDGGITESFFDVFLSPLPSSPSTGTMTITKEHANGGTFDSTLYLRPRFIFTPVGGGTGFVYDPTGTVTIATAASCDWQDSNPVKVVRPCGCSGYNFYPVTDDSLRLNVAGSGYMEVTHKDPLPMDFDDDDDVDFVDFAKFALKWLVGTAVAAP